ncbi:MAG: glycine--tRNA ligase [Candidatus Roizmanbacteria bacterium]
MKRPSIDTITSLAKRRGFVYPSSDIYGGLANTWDFGHYGTLLKKNIQEMWWRRFVTSRDDMVAIEASIFLHPKVWQASGHVENFTDSLIDCKNCKLRTRADHLIEDALPDKKVEGMSVSELTQIIEENKLKCPKCGLSDFTAVRRFNLLFETEMGIVEGDKSHIYLRGELAQGIFINFKNVIDSMRVKIPFGIAQQGKAFRNEITLGQFTHRTIEFDLMEFEYFIHPTQWEEVFTMWQQQMWDFAKDLGIEEENLKWREHEGKELSHYSKRTADIEYQYPFGWKEMFGIAYRTDFDLANHMKSSGAKLEYTDPATNQKYVPHVIEPTFGLSRLLGIVMFESYREEEVNGGTRIYMKLPYAVAPVKVAVFPLQKDEKLKAYAQTIYKHMKKSVSAEFDDSGNIGKMYRRQDEIGTPYCVTIDYQSLEDHTVTIRHRDTMKQERIDVGKIMEYIESTANR